MNDATSASGPRCQCKLQICKHAEPCLLTFHPLPMTVSALLGDRSHGYNLFKSRGACHCTPVATNAQKDIGGSNLLLTVMHVAAIEQSGHSKAMVMWNRVVCVRGCIPASVMYEHVHATRLMTIRTVQFVNNPAVALRKKSHSPFAQRTTNAMPDNTSGVAVPLATATCLAVSAVSFILGRGFDQRRRRGPATTLQDAESVMMPQLAAGKHEVGRAGEWHNCAMYHIVGCFRSAVPKLDHSWVVANRS